MAEEANEDAVTAGSGEALQHISSDNIVKIDPTTGRPKIDLNTGKPELVDNLLGSEDVIEALAGMLLSSDLEPPFTVGVYGSWGTGKTYVLHSIKAELDKRAHDGAAASVAAGVGYEVAPLTVMFEAWQHQADENILVSMLLAAYEELSPEVRKEDENPKTVIMEAIKIAARAALSHVSELRLGLPNIPGLPDFSVALSPENAVRQYDQIMKELNAVNERDKFLEKQEQARLKDRYDEVIGLLASTGSQTATESNSSQPRRRIVFFIDDLDRCLPEVVVNLLEKIKLFLWHPDCVFVIGIDQDQVKTAVAEAKQYRDEGIALHYLEKIINFPFHMPPIGKDFYQDFIGDKLKKCDSKNGVVKIFTAACDERQASLRLMIQLANRYILNEFLVKKALAVNKSTYNPQVMAALTALQVLHEHAFRQVCGRQLNRKEALLAFFDGKQMSEGSKADDTLMLYLDADSVAAMNDLREAAAVADVKVADDLTCYVEFLVSQVSTPEPPSATQGDRIDPSTRIYHFGGYDWRVLAFEEGRALLITNEIIAQRRFDDKSNKWEGSEISDWLNGAFLADFSDEDKQKIVKVNLDDAQPDYQVFLLSVKEARHYFNDNDDRVARYQGSDDWWWLRSPGGSACVAAGVGVGGGVHAGGSSVGSVGDGVRPALGLNL
ncbi:MAG: KAP family NTPase [Coriobacteriales bacterium]|jgi:hypothetical protein|nr:KAP family NTPase [Coriobacteriales bacterium]